MSRSQLFVGRLPMDIRERDVEQVFEKYGRLLRCDVKYGMQGASGRRGSGRTGMAYAFVDYDDRRDAEDAVKYENGREIRGQSIVVEWARGPSNRSGSGRESYGRSTRQMSEECYRCRRPGHWARDCPEIERDRYYPRSRRSRSRSRSRSRRYRRSPSRSRSRSPERQRRSFSDRRKSRSASRERPCRRSPTASISRSKSPSPAKSLSRSVSPVKRNSDKKKSKPRTPSKSASRSPTKSASRSPHKSPDKYDYEEKGVELERNRSESGSPMRSRSRSVSKEHNAGYDNESDRSVSRSKSR